MDEVVRLLSSDRRVAIQAVNEAVLAWERHGAFNRTINRALCAASIDIDSACLTTEPTMIREEELVKWIAVASVLRNRYNLFSKLERKTASQLRLESTLFGRLPSGRNVHKLGTVASDRVSAEGLPFREKNFRSQRWSTVFTQ